MEVPATPANKALASAVSRRMAADARQVNAQAALWRALGIGGAIALAGIGVGAAFFGYSYITDTTSSAERITAAMTAALEKATIRTEGRVQLDTAGQSVRLDAANVRLDAAPLKLDPAAQVKLDPDARVAIEAPPATPKPSRDQLQDGAASENPAAGKVVTDFTVFKNVALGKGRVVTGWNFSSSEQKEPTYQYCYYTTDASGTVSTNTYLAANGAMLPQAKGVEGVDGPAAAASCVWFNGERTRGF